MLSPTRALKLAIKAAAWATPHIQQWHRDRNLNRTEAFRHIECGNWSEAENFFGEALAERNHAAKPRIELLTGLARAQSGSGNRAAAIQTLEAASQLAASSKNLFSQSKVLQTLVDIQLGEGDFAGAEKTAIEIDRLERNLVPPSQPNIAIASRKLGIALRGAQRHGESIIALERAVKFSEQAFGAKHAETGNSCAELGAVLAESGDHPKAQKTLRRALEIHREDPGPLSTEATDDMAQLASSLAECGQFEDAVTEYERLVALGERQIGGDRKARAEAQVRLAALYVQSGRMSQARDLLLPSLNALRKTGSFTYILALEAMACVEEDFGRFKAAQEFRDEAASLSPAQSQDSEVTAEESLPVPDRT